jgi:hypothetical protein
MLANVRDTMHLVAYVEISSIFSAILAPLSNLAPPTYWNRQHITSLGDGNTHVKKVAKRSRTSKFDILCMVLFLCLSWLVFVTY